jgi:anhydro-N-acetylmuramic acid kinase
MADLYIGLMSGTSMDGVDAVLAMPGSAHSKLQLHGHIHRPFEPGLRKALIALNSAGPDELHRSALASNEISLAYADAVTVLLRECSQDAAAIRAIGAHGQTVRHSPTGCGHTGYTIQLLNGSLLAERSGIDVVCDFRSRDIAAGGQGAPLVPGFHAAVFGIDGLPQAILNLGGIANITLLDGAGDVRGFDCGPGNALLDVWCQKHRGAPYDDNGRWSAEGCIDTKLLKRLLEEPYLHKPPPKSTGLDLFNLAWLTSMLAEDTAEISATNVQATLAEFTVRAAVAAIQAHLPPTRRLLVCGGGAFNGALMRRLSELLPSIEVSSTQASGLPAQQVEAAAFAWLAQSFVNRLPGNCPAVTGAAGPRLLGCLYPAY